MNEHEIQEEKNEQELNLFADQPLPEEETSAFPAPSGDASADAMPEETVLHEPASASPMGEDSPVVAPPPRKKTVPPRPGIVEPPRTDRSPVPQAGVPANEKDEPLPPLQKNQTLGQMLTNIRNARGLSLEEVAHTTRIRMEYLVELERDELLAQLPDVYVSAYVRTLIELYGISGENAGILLEKKHEETPNRPEKSPDKVYKFANENAVDNENDIKRIHTFNIVICAILAIILLAIIWLIVLAVARYVRTPAPGPAPAAVSGAVQPAESPISQTVLMDESELDALIVPETPSISILKMSKTPAIRDTP